MTQKDDQITSDDEQTPRGNQLFCGQKFQASKIFDHFSGFSAQRAFTPSLKPMEGP